MAPSRPNTPKRSPCKRSRKSFKWSREHRQMLMVCHRLKLVMDQIHSVFNDIYKPDCQACGLNDGIGHQALRSQWDKAYRAKSKCWNEIESTSTESELEAIRERVESLLHIHPSTSISPRQTDRSTSHTSSFRAARHSLHLPRRPVAQSLSNSASLTRTKRAQRSPPPPALHTDTGDASTDSLADSPNTQVIRKKYAQDTYISPNRTRTVSGIQIPMCNAIGADRVDDSPVMPEEAHSNIPELLFRFYTIQSQGVNSRHDGFLAGYYKYLTIQPTSAPHSTDGRLYVDVLNHLNCIRQASPLISTTSSLFFAIRMAAKLHSSNVRISVIRGSALAAERRIFHVKPYRDRMIERKEFFGGTMTVPGSHEYLVWAKICPELIIHDFAFEDLEAHVTGNLTMYKALRFNNLRCELNNGRVQAEYRRSRIILDLPLTVGLAEFLQFFKVSIEGPTIIARLVSEFVRGWEITLNVSTETQWNIFGDAFVYTLAGHEQHKTLSEEEMTRVKEAFRLGLLTGMGKLNWHLKTADRDAMMRKAAKVGLTPLPHSALALEGVSSQDAARSGTGQSRRQLPSKLQDTSVVGGGHRAGAVFHDEDEDEDEDEGDNDDDVYLLSDDDEEESCYED